MSKSHKQDGDTNRKLPTIEELEAILSNPGRGYVIMPNGEIVDHDSRIKQLESKLAAAKEALAVAKKRLEFFDNWKPADSPDIQEAVIKKLNLVSGEVSALAQWKDKVVEAAIWCRDQFDCHAEDCKCDLCAVLAAEPKPQGGSDGEAGG